MVIYLVRNNLNGKFYVGKTLQTKERRWHEHIRQSELGSERALCRAIRKYGKNSFSVREIAQAQTSDDLNFLEKWFIQILRSNDPRFGYNQTSGGDGGRTWFGRQHTLESKTLISKTLRERYPAPTIELICPTCGNQFARFLRDYNSRIKRGQKSFYCCPNHVYRDVTPKPAGYVNPRKLPEFVEVICTNCGAPKLRKRRYYLASLRRDQTDFYCNHSCQMIHKNNGFRYQFRSKI